LESGLALCRTVGRVDVGPSEVRALVDGVLAQSRHRRAVSARRHGEGRHCAVGLLFAVLVNAQLLLPNPYMPDAVRMAHLIETASSTFIFGLLVGWLLAAPPAR
jgi:hypothetical protein